MLIQGIVGIGKSYFIRTIKKTLETKSFSGKSPLLILAPTRVKTFNTYEKTIHSTLKIPIKDIKPLEKQSLLTFQ